MPDALLRSSSKSIALRSDLGRAAMLVLILCAFLGAYLLLLLSLSEESWNTLGHVLPSLGVAMIGVGVTVLVTTFSFVFVALSLVSMQFSPRVVRHFWHGDRFRLLFLWSFIGIYGLLFVVQFLDSERLHLFALTLSAYGVFVLFPAFLSYLADNINAASITHNISDRTLKEIDSQYARLSDGVVRSASSICSEKSGFLADIDTARLSAVFSQIRRGRPEAVLRASNYLGSFVEIGSPLAVIEPEVELVESQAEELRACFALHKFRSIDQDIEYGIRQLVDIAIKAISPAVNDPTTCVNCIHYLGVIIKELAVRDLRSNTSIELGRSGIFVKEPSFEHYLDDAFDQIYQFGRRDHVIVRTIINVLTDVLAASTDTDRISALIREVDEMELQSLYQDGHEFLFPLVENRDYVRKALSRFYSAAADKFEKPGDQQKRSDLGSLTGIIDASCGR